MENYISLFKTDFFNGLIALSKKTWLKITYSYSIYYGAAIIIGLMFAGIALLGVFDKELFTDMMGSPSPEDSLLLLQQISDLILTPEIIISFIIVIIIVIIMASWNYYFAFLASDAEIKGEEYSFGELLKMSFSQEVFKLAGITIVLNIIISLMFFIAAFSASFSGILAVLMFLAVFVISMRFILVLPAYIIGNYDLNSAFAFSFHHINWSRALKFFGICILAFLVLIGISLIIGLISGVISFIPFIGPIIQIIINVFFGAIMMVITISGLTGLYYRYAGNNSTENIEISSEG